ncbi:glycosyltransferase [Bacillus sp. FJAT-52991]|uniref:Glycosyltransferase n=1 Tax=Bacillus kandeliae TaxID=3129297 RepID=A0ABZ2N6Z4_9BACI
MKTKKKAFFLPSLVGGGAERVILNLAIEFADQGYDVDLILAKAIGEYLDQVPSNINIIDLNSSRVLYSLFPMIQYLKEYKPDSLLSALNHTNIIAICAVLLANVQTKVFVSVHNQLTQFSTNYSRRFVVKLIPFLMKWSFRKAEKVIAVSNGVAEDLQRKIKLPQEKIQVIYNPVVDAGLMKKAKEKIDHPWFESSELPVILATGRLEAEKDFSSLIQAFARVRQKKLAKLIILGEGQEREQLEELIESLGLKDDVWMPGFVVNPYAYMNKADLFVLSSQYEGLPTVLIEALACGSEVISTDCPSGPREVLQNGQYGLLVQVKDVEGMSQAIINKLESPIKQNEQAAYQPFEKKKVFHQYLEIM